MIRLWFEDGLLHKNNLSKLEAFHNLKPPGAYIVVSPRDWAFNKLPEILEDFSFRNVIPGMKLATVKVGSSTLYHNILQPEGWKDIGKRLDRYAHETGQTEFALESDSMWYEVLKNWEDGDLVSECYSYIPSYITIHQQPGCAGIWEDTPWTNDVVQQWLQAIFDGHKKTRPIIHFLSGVAGGNYWWHSENCQQTLLLSAMCADNGVEPVEAVYHYIRNYDSETAARMAHYTRNDVMVWSADYEALLSDF